VKITDIAGNLVYEVISEADNRMGHNRFWEIQGGFGVYMIFISAQDGVETKVK
jgi:hypothetical protein